MFSSLFVAHISVALIHISMLSIRITSILAALALLMISISDAKPSILPRRPIKKVWLTGWRNRTNTEEVKAAPVGLARRPRQGVYVVPPKLEGRCVISTKSKRQICYPDPTLLDTSCNFVQVRGDRLIDSITPPSIANGRLKSIEQVVWPVRLRHRHPRLRPHVSATYECLPGFRFLDEAEAMFCRNRRWIYTTPICVAEIPLDSEELSNPADYVTD